VSCHLGPYVLPRSPDWAFAIKTIEAAVKFSLLFRSERKVTGADARPEVVDQLELLLRGEIVKVQGRLGHAP
jgi:hypothetical protein